MMEILSHRGYWQAEHEKNTLVAFQRSFDLDFGTETDIRDQMGRLVISHDIPISQSMYLSDFLNLLGSKSLYLALNIKADGLAKPLLQTMNEYPSLNWFVFDMSIPDMKVYLDLNIPVFTRISEVERHPIWLEQSSGIWLDAFYTDWYSVELIESFLSQGKKVCIVSSELHGRSQKDLWEKIYSLKKSPNLILCTDYPELARNFFFGDTHNEKN
ncbi:hypothetical protein F993_03766 [Acinetobacter proteolyticus]|uniref:Phosphodiesterase n=1 Tax=Acinetobacter proteolyticus TaxID=1776741 RepID=A0ABN0J9M1_9GAMM|nr:hypothetical protein [Acinetobacter proteolyticus]ENU21837.1 hypothetical protein F993_03766 [Acinetobacter proteolyticus]